MKIETYMQRVNELNEKLAAGKTGTPAKLAAYLHISERCLYSFIDNLKQMGVPIAYCKKSESYIYTRPYKMSIEFQLQELSDEEMTNATGGSIFSHTAFLFQWAGRTL